jgi:hypothetical protein
VGNGTEIFVLTIRLQFHPSKPGTDTCASPSVVAILDLLSVPMEYIRAITMTLFTPFLDYLRKPTSTLLQAINGHCLECGYRLAWILVRGKRLARRVSTARRFIPVRLVCDSASKRRLAMLQNVIILVLPRWRLRFCGGAADSRYVGGHDKTVGIRLPRLRCGAIWLRVKREKALLSGLQTQP